MLVTTYTNKLLNYKLKLFFSPPQVDEEDLGTGHKERRLSLMIKSVIE